MTGPQALLPVQVKSTREGLASYEYDHPLAVTAMDTDGHAAVLRFDARGTTYEITVRADTLRAALALVRP